MRVLSVARGNAASLVRLSSTAARPLWMGVVAALALGCGASAGGEPTAEAAALQPVAAVGTPAANAAAAQATGAAEQAPNASSTASYPAPGGPAPASYSRPLDPEPGPDAGAAPSSPEPDAVLVTQRPLLPPAPAEVVVPPGDCRFEYLGKWMRCENPGWPNVIETDAPDLLSCMQQCLERDDCSAVTDYLWLGLPNLGCRLYVSTCDEPALAESWGEEDGGRDFRRDCSAPTP